ncbi:MAG TPA: DUF4126 domain-containing protein [Burkholderiales bacterium]|nr:DUF4126 domain-containing protein [Burkholderiales bacterium]
MIGTFALVAGLAWASGLRLYLTLFVIGLLVHFQLAALPPAFDILGHPWVLAASGIMLLVEFLADKLPGFDSVWDSVHTFIRIPAGAILAGAAVGQADPVLVAVAAILGGAIASGTHVAKSGTRALINTSPEPFSNWIASFGEEAVLLGGLWAMLKYPLAFLIALALFILLLIWMIPRLVRAMRGVFRPRGGALQPPGGAA